MTTLMRIAGVIVFALGLAGAAAAQNPTAALQDRNASGSRLAEAFFTLLARTGSPTGVVGTTPAQNAASQALVRPFLDPAFQSQQASGERYDAAHYMPTDIDAFTISAVHQTQPAPGLLVVRYAVTTPGATAPDRGAVLGDAPAPRLTVFRWDDAAQRWLVVSHANFNTPLAAICDTAPLQATPVPAAASAADTERGTALARRWFDLLEAGDGRPILHPQVQGQLASGAGYTSAAEYRPGAISAVRIADPVVTRNGRVMVVSLNAQADTTMFRGTQPLGARPTPRLLTFLEGDDGTWSLIATATFNPPRDLPAGAACVRAN